MGIIQYTLAQINERLGLAGTAVQPAALTAETEARSQGDSLLAGAIGTLSDLSTEAKSSLVAAVNELFTSVSDGKTAIAAAITDKGVTAAASETFAALAAKIAQLKPPGAAILDSDHMYYNGILLPTMPTPGGFNYVCLRKNDTTGNYDAICSKTTWYKSSNAITTESSSVKWYALPISGGSSWTEQSVGGSVSFGIDDSRVIVWSNAKIPIGSASATATYFPGSDAVAHYS